MHRPQIIEPILNYYPDLQAIYLFGSYGTENERVESDIDVALLMPIECAKQIEPREWLELSQLLAETAGRDMADLVNLREANTVFCKEIVTTGRRLYCADENAADEFEMLTLSLYQQLQEERREIIEEVIHSGSILHA